MIGIPPQGNAGLKPLQIRDRPKPKNNKGKDKKDEHAPDGKDKSK